MLWIFTLDFSEEPAVAPGPILFLISAAIVMKACSTLVALLALVSRNGIPKLSANSWEELNMVTKKSNVWCSGLQVLIVIETSRSNPVRSLLLQVMSLSFIKIINKKIPKT